MKTNEQDHVLVADRISVRYKIYSRKFNSLKEYLISKIKREKVEATVFEALAGVGVELNKGECVGLIGHNGCGKSTLLKVIAGILDPSSGVVSYRGRLTSLIELGAGFDGELSAIDNIYLSCSLMGVKKAEIARRLEEIISFAELGGFLDFPIKNYSSGMAARLGFACATAVEPDILLVDEVLAVGDEAFQKKCFDRVNDLKRAGKGIILVTHDMNAVERFCDRVYVLESGRLIYEGNAKGGIDAYRKSLGLS